MLFQSLVVTHLEIAKHADECLSVKYGAKIALKKKLWERRLALIQVPSHLRKRTEHHARRIFDQLKKERQQK